MVFNVDATNEGVFISVEALNEEKKRHEKTKKRLVSVLATLATKTQKLDNLKKVLSQYKIQLAAAESGCALTVND